MALQQDNVTFDPAGRYAIISDTPIWSIQQMSTGINFDGSFPEISGVKQRPAITGGQGLWSGLTKGGMFSFQSPGRAIIVETWYSKNCTPAYSISMPNGLTRPLPSAGPFKLAAGEMIIATSTAAAGIAEIGFMARYDTSERN